MTEHERAEIQQQIGALGKDMEGRFGVVNTSLARIEERLAALPCVERGKTINSLECRLKSVEDNLAYARGAAGAAKFVWGYVVAGLLAIGSFVLQLIRVMQGR